MVQQHSEFILTDDEDSKFSDALEEFPFFDASNSFEFEHSLSVSNSSSVYDLDDSNSDSVSKLPKHTPESQSFPSPAGLRRRRLFSRQSSKEYRFKTSSDGLSDFDRHGSNIFPGRSYKFPWNLKENQKLNDKLNPTRVRMSSGIVGKPLTEKTNGNSLNSSAITTVNSDGSVCDRSGTVDSSDSGSNFLITLAGLIIKAIAFQTTLFVAFVTFPVWLTYSSYMFLTDPFAIMRGAKRYMMRNISRFLMFCLGNVRWIVCQWIKRNILAWKLCLQIGCGLLWSAFVGFILVGLLVFAFVISGAIMKCIMEEPVQKIEQLNFDYTRDTPTAFVPIMTCPEPFCLECNEKIRFGNVAQLQKIPVDHVLQVTVSLTLPESDYNRNLGNFQVRVDFLSCNDQSLASTTQPCMMQFKSQPIRLLMTVFKLAPLITGYSSESETMDIKFNGYTERKIPTCCLRVILEPRAEFAKGGGVPEIYTAYLKLESRLPLLKRILWSWKVTVFVWTSIMMFTVGLVIMLLCCMPVIVPQLRLRGVPLRNIGSR